MVRAELKKYESEFQVRIEHGQAFTGRVYPQNKDLAGLIEGIRVAPPAKLLDYDSAALGRVV